jgi:glycosyltransferase involved in cell wall biosynthesis
MRVAVVRGPNLNAWELANFALLDDDVVTFGSRRGSYESHGLPLPVRRLPCPTDYLRRLPWPVPQATWRFAGSTDHLLGLERALRGFDVAHAAELATPYTLQAVAARRRGAVRRVVATAWENIAAPAYENARVARRVGAVAAGVDRWIAISGRARLHLELAGVPGDRIELLPMGVDVEHFAPVPLGRDGGPLRILCVSRLEAEKGVVDLVVAVRLLHDQGIDAELTLVGEGAQRARVEQLVGALRLDGRVRLTGTVAYAGIPALHREADVFVLASAPRTTWQEQFGFAVVEAMASGLPVLAGASGSLDEVVGDDAQLVRPEDPRALATALAELDRDPDLRRGRGARNRARAEGRFDRRKVSGEIRAFYERALAAPAIAP